MRRRRSLWIITLVVLIVILGLEIYLPYMAEDRLRIIFRARVDEVEKLDIRVHSFPSLEILRGKVDRVEVESSGILVNGLYLDYLLAKYRDITLKTGTFTGVNTALQLLITEEALNNYLDREYPDLKNFEIKLNPDQVYMAGILKFFEADLQIQLAGKFTISKDYVISFVPEDFQLEGLKIPASVIQSFLQKAGFSYDLKELNIPLNVNEIKISEGLISVIGSKE